MQNSIGKTKNIYFSGETLKVTGSIALLQLIKSPEVKNVLHFYQSMKNVSFLLEISSSTKNSQYIRCILPEKRVFFEKEDSMSSRKTKPFKTVMFSEALNLFINKPRLCSIFLFFNFIWYCIELSATKYSQ